MSDLGELIDLLKTLPQAATLREGICNPHSYRGYYDRVAFELRQNTVAESLEAARSAVGATYQGWKGGEFPMHRLTEVHIASPGDCGPMLCLRCLKHSMEARDEHTAG